MPTSSSSSSIGTGELASKCSPRHDPRNEYLDKLRREDGWSNDASGSTKRKKAFLKADNTNTLRWDYCFVWHYEKETNIQSWKDKPRKNMSFEDTANFYAEKLRVDEHKKRAVWSSSLEYMIIKQIRRSGLTYKLVLHLQDEGKDDRGLLFLLIGATYERLLQEALRPNSHIRMELDDDQVRFEMRKSHNIQIGDTGTITVYIKRCKTSLIYVVYRRWKLKRILEHLSAVMRMVSEFKPYFRRNGEELLDKVSARARGVHIEDDNGISGLSDTDPLDVRTLALYRVRGHGSRNFACSKVESDTVQDHFYDDDVYVLSDAKLGEPTMNDDGAVYTPSKKIRGTILPTRDEASVEVLPPSRIVQDHVDNFEARIFGGRVALLRGTYTLQAGDAADTMKGYAPFTYDLHDMGLYRQFKPNPLLIDDEEEGLSNAQRGEENTKRILYAGKRLRSTIFTDCMRIKMIGDIIEAPQNSHPRGAGINMDSLLKNRHLDGCFVIASSVEAKVLEQRWHFLDHKQVQNSYIYNTMRYIRSKLFFGASSRKVSPHSLMKGNARPPGQSRCLSLQRLLFTNQSIFYMPLDAYYEISNIADPTTPDLHQKRIPGIRSYFGEKIAFYFAFYEHYNSALLYMAGFGLVLQAAYVYQWSDPKYPTTSSMKALLLVYMLLLVMWQSVVIELWRRDQMLLARRWGTRGYRNIEPERFEFEGGIVRREFLCTESCVDDVTILRNEAHGGYRDETRHENSKRRQREITRRKLAKLWPNKCEAADDQASSLRVTKSPGRCESMWKCSRSAHRASQRPKYERLKVCAINEEEWGRSDISFSAEISAQSRVYDERDVRESILIFDGGQMAKNIGNVPVQLEDVRSKIAVSSFTVCAAHLEERVTALVQLSTDDANARAQMARLLTGPQSVLSETIAATDNIKEFLRIADDGASRRRNLNRYVAREGIVDEVSRAPLLRRLLCCARTTWKIRFENQYQIVHTHIPRPSDGRPVKMDPWERKFLRMALSFAATFLAILAILAIMIFTIALRIHWTFDGDELDESLASTLRGAGVAVIQALVVTIANQAYSRFALLLTAYENHRTESAYQRSRIFKVFLFQFINSYFHLYYAAFWKVMRYTVFGFGPEICRSNPFTEADRADCLYDLSYSVVMLFGGIIVTSNIFELGFGRITSLLKGILRPCLHICFEKKRKRVASRKRLSEEKASPAEKELIRQFYLDTYSGTFDDYAELIVQYGYCALFAVAFPAIPLLALFNNWAIESWLDRRKLLFWRQRPRPKSSEDIGFWLRIMEMMSFIAVLTNTGICIFTSGAFDDDTFATKFGFFILIEHAVFFMQIGLRYIFSRFNESRVHTKREDWILKKLRGAAAATPRSLGVTSKSD